MLGMTQTAAEIMAQSDQVAAVAADFDSLIPWAKNPRRIPESAVSKVAILMCQLGFGAPMLARAEGRRLVAGHTRSKAYRRLREMVENYGDPGPWYEDPETGEKHLSARTPPWFGKEPPPEWFQYMKPDTRQLLLTGKVLVRFMDLTADEANQLAVADNRAGEEAEWDHEGLSELFQAMPAADHYLTGFDANELEVLLAYVPPAQPELPQEGGDVLPEPTPTPPRPTPLRLDDAQRAAFETALLGARELWDRPEMPPAEFLAELSRCWLDAHSPPCADSHGKTPTPLTPSANAFDF